MTKTVGFIGNCQLGTLSGLYRRLLEPESGIDVFYIPSYQSADDAQKALIGSADVIVRQILDFDQKIGALQTDAVVHLFPHVSGAFLWPYTGQAHPKNASFPYFDSNGPYPAEMGDSFLNRMIAENVEPDEAVSRYLNTDVATVKRLDRFQELIFDKQRARDQACGYDFAGIIEARFRTESLFRSPSHLEVPLTMILASKLFERLELDSGIIAKAVADPPSGLFPISATPIHPGVIEKFGLSFADKNHRYRYFDEGSFTFQEYAGRYMRFEWNPMLAEGLHWFRNQEFGRAMAALEDGVVRSPRSAIGRFVLSDLLAKHDRLAEGIQRAREAVELEPKDPHFRQRLDHLLNRRANPPVQPERMSGSNLVMLFGRAGNAHKFQGEGWSNPEAKYTWTAGSRAHLRIAGASTNYGYLLNFSASPYVPAARPVQRFKVSANGVNVAELELDKPAECSVWIPANVVPEVTDTLEITFDLPDAGRPMDFDGGRDDRMLALAFKHLSLDRINAGDIVVASTS
jgi:hypothetical protein